MGPGRGGSGGRGCEPEPRRSRLGAASLGLRPHRSGPLTEDCFHQPGLQVNRPRTLQVLGVKPVGPLGEVTEHLEERPFSLLQLNERRKPLGGGHAAASLAGGSGSADNRRPSMKPAAAMPPALYAGLSASPSPTRALPIGLQASPPKPAAGASSPEGAAALGRARRVLSLGGSIRILPLPRAPGWRPQLGSCGSLNCGCWAARTAPET